MNLQPYGHCVCQRMSSMNTSLCDGQFTFSEQGKKVKMVPRDSEDVAAVVLDGCVFTDDQLKCDGLFLFCGRNKGAAILVELKGGDIERAFQQLSHVRRQRPQYQNFVNNLAGRCKGAISEIAFIVSNKLCSLPVKEKLEDHYGIRVKEILHSEASSKIHDLRSCI